MHLWSLSGGGSNGAWQAGSIFRRWTRGERPQIVAGTSVGALNGILVATGQIHELRKVWWEITDRKVRRKRTNIGLGVGYLIHKIGLKRPALGKWSNEPLKDLVRQTILGRKTTIPYYASMVRIGDGEPDRYIKIDIPAGTMFTESNVDDYVNIIVASTAIPVIFDPVWIGGQCYVDGGVHHQSPIVRAIRNEPVSTMTAICCSPVVNIANQPSDILSMAGWTLDTLLAHQFYTDWESFRKWNQAAEQTDLIIDDVPVKHIQATADFPEEDLGDSMDFSTRKARVLFQKGFDYASEYSARL